jgi:hypothetical protein
MDRPCLLTCRLNSSSAYYNTKTQKKTLKHNTEQTKQKQYGVKKQYKRITTVKALTPKNVDNFIRKVAH